MKRIISLTVTIMFVVFICVLSARATVSFVGEGGINISTISYDPAPAGITVFPRIGLIASTGLEIGLGKWAIHLGGVYEEKGDKEEYTVGNITTTVTTKISYLTIPLILKGISDKKTYKIFYGGGLGIGVLLTAESEVEITDGVSSSSSSVSIKDILNSTDIGAIIDLGLEFGTIITEARVNYGLSNIGKDTGSTTWNNLSVALLCGIKVDL